MRDIVLECEASCTPSPVIVDLDAGELLIPEAEALPTIPKAPAARFVAQCRAVCVPYERVAMGVAEIDPEADSEARQQHNERWAAQPAPPCPPPAAAWMNTRTHAMHRHAMHRHTHTHACTGTRMHRL